MNILKLQDMLKGLPDSRLQQELSSPNGSVPQYLVLSEVMRRQKMRDSFSADNRPEPTVLEEVLMGGAKPKAPAMQPPQMPPQAPQMPQQPPQQPPMGMSNGGFLDPAEAFGKAGFAGRQMQPQMKPQPPMGSLAGPTNLSPQTMAPQQSYQPQRQLISNVGDAMGPLQQYGQMGQNMGNQAGPNMNQPMNQFMPPNNQMMQQPQMYSRGGAVYMANGTQPSREQITQYIREAAAKRGIDPDIALRVARSEGLDANPEEGYQSFVKDKQGNREESYGIFQLNMAPGAVGDMMLKTTGVHPKDNVFAAIDFALDTANKTGWTPWMGAKAVGIGAREGLGGTPSPASDTTVMNNERIRNPADVAAGIGGEQDGTFAGGATPSEIEDADAFSFFDFLKSKKGNFKDLSSDIGEALLKPQQRQAPSGGMIRGNPAGAAQYGKREMDLINAYKKAAEAALQESGGIQFMPGRGIMALAGGGPVYMAEGEFVTDEFLTYPEPEVPEGEDAPTIMSREDAPMFNVDQPRGPTDSSGRTGRTPVTNADPREGMSPAELLQYETALAREAAARSARNAPAQPSGQSELDLYRQYMENALRLNKEFLDERRQAAEDARGGGMGQFLRRLGIGVLSSPSGRFGDIVASGFTNVASAEDKARQDYLDRIGKLDEAELAYQLQSAKLPYEIAKLTRESSGAPSAKEIRDALLDQRKQIITAMSKGNELTSPEQMQQLRQDLIAVDAELKRYGIPISTGTSANAITPEQLSGMGVQ